MEVIEENSDEKVKQMVDDMSPDQMAEMEKLMAGLGGMGAGMEKMKNLQAMGEGMGGLSGMREPDPEGLAALEEYEKATASVKDLSSGDQTASPQSKISIKMARKFMKDVIETLTTPGSAKEIDAANLSAAKAKIIEKLVIALMEKYKFKGGLAQAIQSVEEAGKRKGDPNVKTALDIFYKLAGVDAGKYKPAVDDANIDDKIRAVEEKLKRKLAAFNSQEL